MSPPGHRPHVRPLRAVADPVVATGAGPAQDSFGAVLRAYRTRRGMTQQQLADLSTVSVRAIRDIESGKAARPRLETVRLIADGLGLTGRSRAEFERAARRATVDSLRHLLHDRTPAAPPAALDPLIGRDREVAALVRTLAAGAQRLVTVTGLATVGKSRVALEAAATVHRLTGLPVLWAGGGEAPGAGRRPVPGVLADLLTGSGVTELGSVIRDRAVLLVLDGHPPGRIRPDPLVTLLQDCPGLRVLVTARAPLEVAGELAFPLPPLPVPSPAEAADVEHLLSVPSVQLLVGQVRRLQPGFALTERQAGAVAALCRHLDGMPAALAGLAPLSLVYGWEALAREAATDPLGQVLRSAVDGASAGLAEAITHAVGSLDVDTQAFLATLADAEGGWSVDDAAALTAQPAMACAATVQRLLTRGLVRPVDQACRPRFVVLGLVRHVLRRREPARILPLKLPSARVGDA